MIRTSDTGFLQASEQLVRNWYKIDFQSKNYYKNCNYANHTRSVQQLTQYHMSESFELEGGRT